MRLHTDDVQIVSGIVPVDLSSADNNGDFINLSKYRSVMVIFFKGIGNAGQDPTLTIQQATDVAGTDVKGLDFDTIYVKQGTLTSVGQFTKIEQTAASIATRWHATGRSPTGRSFFRSRRSGSRSFP